MNINQKIFSILSASQKKKFAFVSVLNLISTVLELLGLALIFPVVSILVNYEKFINIFKDYDYFNLLNINEQKQVIIFIMIILATFFLIKGIFSILINYIKSRIFFSLIASITSTMFKGYLNQGVAFLQKENSAYITRKIIEHPIIFVHHVLQSYYNIIFDTFLILGAFSIFFIANKTVGILISVGVICFILGFYFFNKNKTREYGKSLNHRFNERLKTTREVIEGINDINLYKKNKFFENLFEDHNYKIASLTSILAIRELLPKVILEFLAVFTVSALIIFFISNGLSGEEIVPIISLVAAGLIRINPSASKILSSLQRIKSSTPSTDDLYNEIQKFRKIDKNKDIKFNFSNRLTLKNVSFSFDENKVFENLNFEINNKSIFGIKGKSGSGKSTLINLIIGFYNPDSGKIMADDTEILDNISNWQNLIGYVPQKIFLTDDTLEKNIAFGVEEDDIKFDKLDNVIKHSQLNEFISDREFGLKTKIGERGKQISAGQVQRIGIARALYKNPKILIFDEATSALDKKTEKKIIEDVVNLKNKGITVILVSHEPSVLEYCDTFYDLDENKYIKN